ncbi:alpha-xylosidase [Gephyromycinifex aptenodytis]|uniref:alpha-xylosidase n=1 Tax=Gephyromycinifex aptenodytis TaxID=2716227 RepID=UPI001447734D|nr:alpha-xylosidase [Gephyromycinifex aptenodytis]
MKFTDGYWIKKPGYVVEHPRQIQEILATDTGLVAYAPTRVVRRHGDELDSPILTTTIDALAPDVVRVRLEHFQGEPDLTPCFELADLDATPQATVEGCTAILRTGDLQVHVSGADQYMVSFRAKGKELTSAIPRSTGLVTIPDGQTFVHEQLTLAVGEAVYGLGERFGPAVRNGQSVDIWNDDGGTATEHAYKNVPFYLTNAGYGVFVNHTERVSLEVGSEINTRVQFSVPGQKLEYILIYGPTPKDILRKYTALTGRAPQVPAWSYGLWLSTSFTTDYSEETVNGFVDKMEELELPLSVLHFDCYWMRPSHWCDFTWDPAKFPDPEGMLSRYHERGLKVCVWINPYIGQRSHLFAEGKRRGYLLKRPDGAVRQWDHWQSGMAWVDFTNPDATAWWKGELKKLLAQGVDSFKTDFGERVPTDVVWHDGSDPHKMHNFYSYLYNKAAFEAIAEVKGEDEALVFARAATTGGQSFPVHWGGDSEPTFVSMAETLRGGLSLGLSGFGYWSHDMGGFEGTPTDDVFIRWFPFGMLSSHSRLHGSHSYRVPWNYGDKAVEVARRFIALKNRLMPYLLTHAQEITDAGTPLMRHMVLEYPNDRGATHVDTQYLLGPDILVAPVFTASGEVDVYLPTDGWTDILSGEHFTRRGWVHQTHGLETLPLLVADGTVLPLGAVTDRPEYDWCNELLLYIVNPTEGTKIVRAPHPDGTWAEFTVSRKGADMTVSAAGTSQPWKAAIVGASIENLVTGRSAKDVPASEIIGGTVLEPQDNVLVFRLA